jgi:hypothetical protein
MLSSIWSVGRLVGQPSAGRGFTGGSNPFLDPPRYIPPGGEAAADLSLRVHETLHVYDAALIPHTASAVLDTGRAEALLLFSPSLLFTTTGKALIRIK